MSLGWIFTIIIIILKASIFGSITCQSSFFVVNEPLSTHQKKKKLKFGNFPK
jgi:hypothetical protein